jgi:lysyl-tRNA synthetase class 2
VNVFRFVPGYESAIYDRGREPLFILCLSFLITFICVRGYTRLARSRGWGSGSIGGTHLHHIVPGLIIAFLGGLIAFSPWGHSELTREAGAILFGAGGALVLDEFALVFRLRDVYWQEEGRASVTAALMGLTLGVLLLVATSPFDRDASTDDGVAAFFGLLAANLVFALIAFLKGKPYFGILAVFTPIGWIAAVRLAKPRSPWSRWFYEKPGGRRPERRARKLERSRVRFADHPFDRLAGWVVRVVGG